jgi:putative oxidoreductase
LQRFFSTFPNGWPGTGLLLLRLAAGLPLIVRGLLAAQRMFDPGAFVLPGIALVVGIFLLLGLWTPFSGLSALCIDLLKMISRDGDEAYHMHMAALALSLVMLGPGAWSIDARLFGRKRIDF